MSLIEAVDSHVPSIFIALNDLLESKDYNEAIKIDGSWEWTMSIQSIFEIIEKIDVKLGDRVGGWQEIKKS